MNNITARNNLYIGFCMKQIKLNENLYLQPHENGIIIHLPDDQSLKIDEKVFLLIYFMKLKILE